MGQWHQERSVGSPQNPFDPIPSSLSAIERNNKKEQTTKRLADPDTGLFAQRHFLSVVIALESYGQERIKERFFEYIFRRICFQKTDFDIFVSIIMKRQCSKL